MKKERPFELNIVIVIAIFFGLVTIIMSRYYIINEETLFSNVNKDILSYFMAYMYASIVIGIIQIIVAYGLYRGILWAWYLAVIGCCGFIISNLIFVILVFPDVFSLLISIGCLFLLYKPKVREYFLKT